MKLPQSPIAQDPLPFEPDDLAPIISPATILAHYRGHHAAYVKNFNTLLREKGPPDLLRFNYQGHKLHALYWETLIPGGSNYPRDHLGRQILKQGGPGARERLLESLFKKSSSLRGSGWAILAAHPCTREVSVRTIKEHDVLSLRGYVPLVIIDCWEHAYYLDYAFNKKEFFTDFLSLINWDIAESRFVSF